MKLGHYDWGDRLSDFEYESLEKRMWTHYLCFRFKERQKLLVDRDLQFFNLIESFVDVHTFDFRMKFGELRVASIRSLIASR